jgi:hypothetical protein
MKSSTAVVRNTRLIAGIVAASALATQYAHAQTYTVVELAPDSIVSLANTIASGAAAGSSVYPGYPSGQGSHATLWNGSSRIDLNPAILLDAVNGLYGFSSVSGSTDSLQVGWGYGPTLQNRYAPLAWNGTADTARILALPFTNAGGQALATDGNQIVGYGTGLNKDGSTIGPTHALVWDAATEQPVDLGTGSNGAQALGVGGGQQVGYIIKTTQNAALWTGSPKSLVVLHPQNAQASALNGTDGVNQVGWSNYSIRVRAEAANGNKDKTFAYATVWTGTAASAVTIHPGYTHSYAKAINGPWIVGYATEVFNTGAPSINHAIAWDSAYQATDLNAFLPTQFVSAQALSVDDQGNVAGIAFTANGARHAVIWTLDPAQ